MLFLISPPAIQAPPQGPPQGGQMGPSMGGPMGHPGGGHPPVDIPLLRVSRELGLSEEQSLKLHEVCRAHLDALETKELAFHQAQRAVHEAIQAPGISAQALSALVNTASSREGELVEEVRQVTAEGWKVLSAAQQQKAKLLMANPPEMGPGGRGPGRGGPMGGQGGGPMGGGQMGGPGRGPGGFQGGPQNGPQGPPPQGPPPDGMED